MELYEYAIIRGEERDEKGKLTRKAELVQRGDVMARDEKQAQMLAARELTVELAEDMDSVQVLVRPFCE